MTNKPKNIGTAAETAVTRACLPFFPEAERRVLHGDADQGDIKLNRHWIVEVKGGKQTLQVGDKLMKKWTDEMWTEIGHAGARYGFLVLQRAGVGGPNEHRWWAFIPLGFLIELRNGDSLPGHAYDTMVRLELGKLLQILALTGETDALPDAA
jgi:hypothetical protein